MGFVNSTGAQKRGGGEYVKFETPGQTVSGRILAFTLEDNYDRTGKDPVVLFKPDHDPDPEARAKLQLGNTIAHDLFVEQDPDIGDWFQMAYVGKIGQAKNFTLQVQRAGQPAVQAPAGAPQPQPGYGYPPQPQMAQQAPVAPPQQGYPAPAPQGYAAPAPQGYGAPPAPPAQPLA